MKKIYLIGNAHLDPVWLWQWQEGFSEIKATFRSALDRMKEFDDFIFTSACGAYYMWIEKSDPDMFAEIQQRVNEGRWCLVGGWFIQPDCNIPCGESFARHSLITQRYFMDRFKRYAKTGYNVDSFGHNGNLPQILRNSKMSNYVFMRPQEHEKELPQHLFCWESADGSRVMTYRIPFFYNIETKRWDSFSKIEDLKENTDLMAFYGVGNHGGGATVSLLERMHNQLPTERYLYSDPDTYFSCQNEAQLPIVKGDLQYHAKGCYSAFSEIKKNNRMAENVTLTAEVASVLSAYLMKIAYPKEALDQAWKNILFNQFHDIMGGCCIREAFDDAKLVHGEALSIAQRTTNFALQQISWNIDTIGSKTTSTSISESEANEIGTPVVVFNPLPYRVRNTVALRFQFQLCKRITDINGNEVPIQYVRDSKTDGNKKEAVLFEADVPALGYTVYRWYDGNSLQEYQNPFTITEYSIGNPNLQITFDPNSGEICSLYDRIRNRELLSVSTKMTMWNDEQYDTWAHGIEKFDKECPMDTKANVSVIEKGPVRATVRVEQTFGNSRVIREYSLLQDSNSVEVKTKIDFHERFRILKFAFPICATNSNVFCKIPFGSIERPSDGSEQVCGDWIAIKGDEGGVGIASDCKHSFDANGNILSLTVLRSALFADHYGVRDEFCEFMEQGEHCFYYRIFSFDKIGEAERQSAELQIRPITIRETFHKGTLAESFCGASVSADNVVITAIKKHEDSDGYILRCYECEGIDTNVNIQLFDTSFFTHIKHHQIKTFLIRQGAVTETDFIE